MIVESQLGELSSHNNLNKDEDSDVTMQNPLCVLF